MLIRTPNPNTPLPPDRLAGAGRAFDPHFIPAALNRTDYARMENLPGYSRILLVEDNPADVLLLREALAWHDVKSYLFHARDGDDAFRLIEEIEATTSPCPDLFVLDVNLPGKSGFDVLRRVRASRKCSASPVAVLSSSEAASDRAQAARLGASVYIRKPSNLTDFMSVGETLKAIIAAGHR